MRTSLRWYRTSYIAESRADAEIVRHAWGSGGPYWDENGLTSALLPDWGVCGLMKKLQVSRSPLCSPEGSNRPATPGPAEPENRQVNDTAQQFGTVQSP